MAAYVQKFMWEIWREELVQSIERSLELNKIKWSSLGGSGVMFNGRIELELPRLVNNACQSLKEFAEKHDRTEDILETTPGPAD